MKLEIVMTGIFNALESAHRYISRIKFSELESVDLDDIQFLDKLPCDSAIYFILNKKKRPVYVGKAVKMKARWNKHHCLSRARSERDMKLAWITLAPAFLMTFESLFILIHRPAWNKHEFLEEKDFTVCDPDRLIYWNKCDNEDHNDFVSVLIRPLKRKGPEAEAPRPKIGNNMQSKNLTC